MFFSEFSEIISEFFFFTSGLIFNEHVFLELVWANEAGVSFGHFGFFSQIKKSFVCFFKRSLSANLDTEKNLFTPKFSLSVRSSFCPSATQDVTLWGKCEFLSCYLG